jgi:hypothetical protein
MVAAVVVVIVATSPPGTLEVTEDCTLAELIELLEDPVIVEVTSAVAAGADAFHKFATSKPAVASAAETAVRFPVKAIMFFVKAMISVATVSFTVTDNSIFCVC